MINNPYQLRQCLVVISPLSSAISSLKYFNGRGICKTYNNLCLFFKIETDVLQIFNDKMAGSHELKTELEVKTIRY